MASTNIKNSTIFETVLQKRAVFFIPKAMKKLLFLGLVSVFTSSLFAQKVQFVDSALLQRLDLKDFTIVNLSATQEATVDQSTDFFFDFNVSDMPLQAVDSMVIELGDKRFVNAVFSPFLLTGAEYAELLVYAMKDGDTLALKGSGTHVFQFEAKPSKAEPFLAKDTVVFGLLAIILALIFYTSSLQTTFWKRLYTFLPALLLCYLIPALFNSFGIISEDTSGLYNMAKDYLLPAALVLMTLGIDFKALINLGPKALIMFLTGTLGIIIGGPLAILIFTYFDPTVVGGEGYDATWRGFSTLAGSWIGGGANQAAMLETYRYNPDLYGKMVTIDIVVANLWMAFLLWAAARADKFDKWLKADSSSIEELKNRTVAYQDSISKIPTLTDYMVILGIAFGVVSVSHFFGADLASFFTAKLGEESPFASGFFWLVVLATSGGLALSFTKLRKYEGAGASKIGSVFIYILVVTIGMKMGLKQALEEPMLILVGIVWMLIHAALMFLVAKMIKAPFFFIAVGSKANVGGAASAPVVAAAFHPSLASVGAILAVLGYALGTYGAIVSAELMRWIAP